jgi:hypothetical protein
MKRQREAMRDSGAGMRARSRIGRGSVWLRSPRPRLCFVLALLPGPERRVYAGTDASGNRTTRVAAGTSAFARRRAALRALPAERRGARARCGAATRDQTVAVGRVPRGFSALSPDGDRLFCHQLLGRHALSDRYAHAGVVATWPVGASRPASSRTRRASTFLLPTASPATSPCWMRRRALKKSACWPGAARVI